MESERGEKINKCGYDSFKIHKKKSYCVDTSYHNLNVSTVSSQCLTRKWEERSFEVLKFQKH